MLRTPNANSTGRRSITKGVTTTSSPQMTTSPLSTCVPVTKPSPRKAIAPPLNTTFDLNPATSAVRRLSGNYERKTVAKPPSQTAKATTGTVMVHQISNVTKTSTGAVSKVKPKPPTNTPELTASDVIASNRSKPLLVGLLELISFASNRLGDTRNMKGEIKRDLTETFKHLRLTLEDMNKSGKTVADKTESFELAEGSAKEDSNVNAKLDSILDEIRSLKEQHQNTMQAATPRKAIDARPTLHSVIVTSKNEADTGDTVLERIREAVDAKEGWVTVSRIRKAKGGKVIMSCDTKEEREKVKKRLDNASKDLVAEIAKNKDPLIVAKSVLRARSDAEVLEAMRKQNKAVFQDLSDEDNCVAIKYKKKTRNPHTHHIVLQVSPKIWGRLTNMGFMHIDLQRIQVEDQSPLVQCSQCLGYGHSRGFCGEKEVWCSHCGNAGHILTDCPTWTDAGAPPSCRNCCRAQLTQKEHNAFSMDCPIRRKWDRMARSAVQYC